MIYLAIGIATTTLYILARNYSRIMNGVMRNVALRLNEASNNCSVAKIENNIYQVIYSIAGKEYRMLVKPDRGPTEIKIVAWNDEQQSSEGNDVTEEVLPYLGPNPTSYVGKTIVAGEKFSSPSLTFGPSDFGYCKFSISSSQDNEE